MNMLASLKALLFSTTSRGTGATPPAAPGETPDFAAMLSGSMVEGASAEAVTSPSAPALPQAEGQAATAITPDLSVKVGQPPARPPHDHVPPGLAIGLVKHAAEPQIEAEAPVEAPSSQLQVTDEATEAVSPVKEHQLHQMAVAPEAPVAIDIDTAPVEAKPAHTKKAKAGEAEPKDSAPASAPYLQLVPQPIAAPAIGAEPAPIPTAEEPTPALSAEQSTPVTNAAPIAQTVVPPAPSLPITQVPPAPPSGAEPAPASHGDTPVSASDTTKAGAGNDVKVPTPNPQQIPQPAADQPGSIAENMAPAAPILNGKPVKAEALALLQLVREQVAAHQSGASSARVGEQVSAAAHVKDSQPAPVTDAAPNPSFAAASADMTPLTPSAVPSLATGAVPSPAAPVVGLSASLGAQVVDMGVSGQWIDALARDIAGLSANGAQGRFQVNTGQLGAVQVDIRHGADGAAVSLTVASEAAELALRQDSDRLKLDSALSAVRIAEVRVERAPVGESARSDMGGDSSQRQSSQQQPGSQANSAWQNNSQNMGQSQGQQGRWQSRENSGFGSKSTGDPAVLNHAEARQDASGAGRARYA